MGMLDFASRPDKIRLGVLVAFCLCSGEPQEKKRKDIKEFTASAFKAAIKKNKFVC